MDFEISNSDSNAKMSEAPFIDMGAYEFMWTQDGASFASLSATFKVKPAKTPSHMTTIEEALEHALAAHCIIMDSGVPAYGIRVHGLDGYPMKLRDAKNPIEVLWYRGDWSLASFPKSLAVIGSRNASANGRRMAAEIAGRAAQEGILVTSGLAKGIDAAAHTAALEAGGRTLAVLGTPIHGSYPKENADLQREIAENHLLVSQVPVIHHSLADNPRMNSHFFPARNATMSAMSDATIIVEAGEKSGTVHQAKAALEQGRKLFIMESCRGNSWMGKFIAKGAIPVRHADEAIAVMNGESTGNKAVDNLFA